jgi:hypothetical protein
MLRLALHYLALRHVRYQTDLLARFAIAHATQLTSDWHLSEVASVLANFPEGPWDQALLALGNVSYEARLAMVRNRLALRSDVRQSCRELVISRFNKAITGRDLQHNPDVQLGIDLMLLESPPEDVEDRLHDLFWREPKYIGRQVLTVFSGQLVADASQMAFRMDLEGGFSSTNDFWPQGQHHSDKGPSAIQINEPPRISTYDVDYSDWVFARNHEAWTELTSSAGASPIYTLARDRGYGAFVAIAALSGSDEPEAEQILTGLCSDPVKGQWALRAISHRDLHTHSEQLASCVIEYANAQIPHTEEFKDTRFDPSPIVPLIKRKSNRWDEALVALIALDGSEEGYGPILKEMRSFSESSRKRLRDVLDTKWKVDVEPYGVKDLVRLSLYLGIDRDYMKQGISTALTKAEKAPDGKYFRDVRIKELRDALSLLK